MTIGWSGGEISLCVCVCGKGRESTSGGNITVCVERRGRVRLG